MRKILVTGKIASGKSEVCRHLEAAGFPVYDSDSRARALYDTVPGLRAGLEARLGLPFSRWNEVFSDPAKLNILESAVHPIVLEDFLDWAGRQTSDTVIFESALALDRPLFKEVFDIVVMVRAPLGMRVLRNSKAAGRDRFQTCDSSEADYIIDNDSDMESLYRQTDILISKL